VTRRCVICARDDVAAVDVALRAGSSLRAVAAAHPGASRSALSRHKEHTRKPRAKAEPAEPLPAMSGDLRVVSMAEDLGQYIRARLGVLQRRQGKLSEAERDRAAASLSVALVRLGKVTGETLEIPNAKLVKLPAFRSVVEDMVRALKPYPEAMAAVAAELERIERGDPR
jgi:hypothetical protein